MANYIALVFLVVGLFLIISMLWKNYKDNQIAKKGFNKNFARNDRGLTIALGIFFLLISLLIKLFS